MSRKELLKIIEKAAREGWEVLNLSFESTSNLPDEIGQLTNLQTLYLSKSLLMTLPRTIGQLANLQKLYLRENRLTSLPQEIGQLTNLQRLWIQHNQVTSLPQEIGQLTNLEELNIWDNQVTSLPQEIGQLTNLLMLTLDNNRLTSLPQEIGQLINLEELSISDNRLTSLPQEIGQLTNLLVLTLDNNRLTSLPQEISQLANLQKLYLRENQLTSLPKLIGQLTNLENLFLHYNQLTSLPSSLARLKKLEILDLDGNPLNPALQSAYEAGFDELRAYLHSLEAAEPLYEAKMVLVGEGGVGKTTLLKAMMGREGEEPRADEPTTHGVKIDIESLHLPHPEKEGVEIKFNAWDFGGQEVYRVTHQFFFSPQAIYLLVWKPRIGVEQSRVEDWLKMIKLRVGDDARVIIISTHCKTGERLAQIDEPVFLRDFGSMIVGFHEVDSLVKDPATGEYVGVKELKDLIAQTAKDLRQMGMGFNIEWKAARDELLAMEPPRITYKKFAEVCAGHNLDAISTKTLAGLMHDLGYIVYYGDDEHLKDDVVLKPEWLTKAIGLVLEDRMTREMDGILPDSRLEEVWWEKPVDKTTRFEPKLYPFFLQLMQKYDVSYRLKYQSQDVEDASLVAQHVPQVRPRLPWLPEEDPRKNRRRIAMVCVMDEEPPGLVPWMIVRTHEYACEEQDADDAVHRLHWRKGMFLRNKSHGEAMLELRGREFHVYAEAVWPEYFMNVLRRTLHKLITDNWPGLEGRYTFSVPCREKINGKACDGRFDIDALRQFLEEGDETLRCQDCRKKQNIVRLLFGFEVEAKDSRTQLSRIDNNIELVRTEAPQWTVGQPLAEEKLLKIESKIDLLSQDTRTIGVVLKRDIDGLKQELGEWESRMANYVMAIMHAMASEAKNGPRLFSIEPVDGNWRRWIAKKYRLHLWCEAEGCQHPVHEEGLGVYEFKATREWVNKTAPYANFIAGVLKTVLPVAGPAANILFGANTIDESGLKDHLELMKEATANLPGIAFERDDPSRLHQSMLSGAERSGILELHALLRALDPHHKKLGLTRLLTPTGDFQWLCETHFQQIHPPIPDTIG